MRAALYFFASSVERNQHNFCHNSKFKKLLIYSFGKHFNIIKVSDRYEVPHMIIETYGLGGNT